MFGLSKTHKELEGILVRLHANASNNYKDAAQDNYREFQQKFSELKAAGKLKARQLAYYEEKMRELEPSMKHYTHYEQRGDFHGLGEIQKK